jgi:hypothetical protein
MNEHSEKQRSQTPAVTRATDLAPPDYHDPVIEAYKKDVDRTLLRENLKLSVEERIRKAEQIHASVAAWREAGKHLAGTGRKDGS